MTRIYLIILLIIPLISCKDEMDFNEECLELSNCHYSTYTTESEVIDDLTGKWKGDYFVCPNDYDDSSGGYYVIYFHEDSRYYKPNGQNQPIVGKYSITLINNSHKLILSDLSGQYVISEQFIYLCQNEMILAESECDWCYSKFTRI